MRTTLFALLFSGVFFTTYSQSGYYYQTHFSPIENLRDQLHYAIEQDEWGRLFFASRQGLLYFDGSNWDLIETPGPTFAIEAFDSAIYLAGTYGFGKLRNDIYGNLTFSSLNDSTVIKGEITQLVTYESSLAMTDGKNGYFYTPADQRWEKMNATLPVSSLSRFQSKLLAINSDTSFVIKGDPTLPGEYHEKGPWLLWSQSPDGHWLGINAGHQLFAVQNNLVEPFTIEDEGYLAASHPVSLHWVNQSLLAAGTLLGGVVFIDVAGKKLDQIVNYHTGLPDNEIQLLYGDKDAALWVAHAYGYSRISPGTPFKSYNYYPGLDGTLYTSLHFNNRVYAGTNLGLFYLDEVKNFEEVVYYIKKNPETRLTEESKPDKRNTEARLLSFLKFNKGEKVAEVPAAAVAADVEADDETKKKGLFSFLKKNKVKEAENSDEKEIVVAKNTPVPSKTKARKTSDETTQKPQLVRRVKKELQSITYVYKKLKGIDGRVSQLIPLSENEILASGLAGVFVVNGDNAAQIHAEAVRRVFYSANQRLILVATYKGALLAVSKTEDKWKEVTLLENLDDYIQHIFEDREGRIWLCTAKKLYWTRLKDNTLVDAGEIEMPNDYLDPVVGVDDEQLGVIFLHSKGFYRLNGTSVEAFGWNGMQKPERYLSSKGQLLISDGRSWYRMGRGFTENGTFAFLNVFDDIVSVDFENDGDLYLITADNNFYRIDHTKAFLADYQPFLKHIRTVSNQLLPIGKELKVEQENSSLSFFFNQAEYSGILKVEYRYRLVGLNEEWSEWSPNNNTIQFSYLPTNEYELQVETRNSFGLIKSLEPVYFSVVPPYWKRPWFYAAELFIFGLLLFISSRLTRSERMHLQVVNRLLAFLTIIMIIEFIQTLVESNFETDSSPVISFFLQVSVAFCLLPLESFMRKRLSTRNNKVDELVQSHVSKIKENIVRPKLKKLAADEKK